MSDEEKRQRINIEDLPVAESELSAEEAEKVTGGAVWHELVILGDVAAAKPTNQISPSKPKTTP